MASGDTLVCFFPNAAEPPASNYGTFDTRNSHPVIDLALNEEIRFTGIMPQHYSASTGITIYLHYAMTSAVASDIKLETSIERIGDGVQDLDADGFAAAQNTGDITVPGTSGLVDIITTAHTNGAQMDGLLIGESFRLNVKRVTVTGDDAAGDLELVACEIRET